MHSEDRDSPVGVNCPGCGQLAGLIISARQAFCGNDGCRILMWDPARTLNELLSDLQVTDLQGFGDSNGPR